MRIAVAQIVSSTDPESNLTLIAEHARPAADAGAELVVFPEATMASFATASAGVAEPLDGPFAQRVREIAAASGVTVALGMFTSADRLPRNTLLVTGPDGEASYDKLHLFDALGFTESDYITPGERPVLTRIGAADVGLAICFDVRFPELFKHYGRLGAQVVIVPASWAGGPGKAEQWKALCVARASDATCFVIGAGQADPTSVGVRVKPGSPTGVGHSVVVDPLGRLLAEAGEAPELLVVDLDLGAVADARARMPVLEASRFGLVAPDEGRR